MFTVLNQKTSNSSMKHIINHLTTTVQSGETEFTYGFIYLVVAAVICMVITVIRVQRKETIKNLSI